MNYPNSYVSQSASVALLYRILSTPVQIIFEEPLFSDEKGRRDSRRQGRRERAG